MVFFFVMKQFHSVVLWLHSPWMHISCFLPVENAKQNGWRIALRAGIREISLVLHLRGANMGKLLQLCCFLFCFPTSETRQYLGDDLYVCRPSAGSCFLNMLSCWSKHMNVGYWKSIITYLRARDARVDDTSASNHTGLELVLQICWLREGRHSGK